MELNQIAQPSQLDSTSNVDCKAQESFVTLEAEVPEALFDGMKEFILTNPKWDQYQVMTSAIANFLFQNGCTERAITEKYLNDLFNLSESL